MQKVIITLLIFIALVLVALVGWTVMNRGSSDVQDKTPSSENGGNIFPSGADSGTGVPTGENQMLIPLADGRVVRVHDIRKDEGTRADIGATYKLFTFVNAGVDTDQLPPYKILYSEIDHGFLVNLYENPLGLTRARAERDFLRRLEISETEACALRVSVGTIDGVDEFFAGKELGLSFCPGAMSLPE